MPPLDTRGEFGLDIAAVPLNQIAIAVLLGLVIAAAAYRGETLDKGGAIAAAVLGPAVATVGGWWLAVLLVSFFLASSLLPSSDEKSPSRTWQQVLANGGPALGFAIVSLGVVESAMLVASAATLSAVTADTFATEIGRRYGGRPISIRTRRSVEPGTSGAVTIAGLLASVFGASMISFIAIATSQVSQRNIDFEKTEMLIILGCGVGGSLIDTILGATVQARFSCSRCQYRSESADPHLPEHIMTSSSGISWITNSTVNWLAASLSGIIALALEFAFIM